MTIKIGRDVGNRITVSFPYNPVGEVVRLKIKDIDAQRKLIHMHGAKGRKERCSTLSRVALKTLQEYVDLYRPQKRLFPNGRPLSSQKNLNFANAL